MKPGDAVWRALSLAIVAALVAASVMLMAAAVGAMMLGAERSLQWELFGEGFACWVAGILWGWTLNGGSSWLRQPWQG